MEHYKKLLYLIISLKDLLYLYIYRNIIYSEIKNHNFARYFPFVYKWKAYRNEFHKFYRVSMHLNPTRLFNIPIKINDLIAIKCLQKGVEMKVHTKVTTANTGNGLQHTSCAKLQS